MYYNGYEILTYNKLFNFILSERGLGKTYWFKEWAIKDYLKTGAEFVYLRRYDSEFQEVKAFWKDIQENFPDNEFGVDGRHLMIDGKIAGYAIPLSTSTKLKSTPFPKVNKIGYDEFIIDKSTYKYLKNEPVIYLDFYQTVARKRDNVRAIFLSNSITQTNPYFLYFKIRLPQNKKGITTQGDILLQLAGNAEFRNEMKSTRFGRLIEGTEYAAYSIDNKFLLDNDTFILKKSEKATYSFTFKYMGNLYGVWADYSQGRLFVSDDVDPFCKLIYSVTLDDHTPNTMLLKRLNNSIMFKGFIDNYKLGNVYFENMRIKNIVYDVIRLTIS